ncbi:MAG: hypothetical protein DIZ80_17320 [endosymbiont of Galathealinum brachiosum]|uniref:Uncharacterized protein n=1 Tax=endosymbiont of Galathealinum brachiosum TaxID=2200906 RepID=A0A370D707_9GAMM|nr:MAG: hypothetical protein DIZ80_17320 [endosymbiont of Galathealinum brachiosum]
MTFIKTDKPVAIWVISIIAVVFGLLTIKSGGSVIFIDGIDRKNAGNYIPFVVWFNFLAGFAYVIAGTGLFMKKSWAARLSFLITISTLIIFILLGLHILNNQAYETRTVIAMSLRTTIWTLISIFSYIKLIKPA